MNGKDIAKGKKEAMKAPGGVLFADTVIILFTSSALAIPSYLAQLVIEPIAAAMPVPVPVQEWAWIFWVAFGLVSALVSSFKHGGGGVFFSVIFTSLFAYAAIYM